MVLVMQTLDSLSPKNALSQVWLKLTQWFCRRRFYISSMYFHYFFHYFNYLLWKRVVPFIWTNLNPLYPRMLCAKFGWNWNRGSGEEDENVKSLRRQQQQRRRRTTDKFWSEKLTWAFGSDELKRRLMFFCFSNQRYDIIIALNKCVYWYQLVSQTSDVAHGPLVFWFFWFFVLFFFGVFFVVKKHLVYCFVCKLVSDLTLITHKHFLYVYNIYSTSLLI